MADLAEASKDVFEHGVAFGVNMAPIPECSSKIGDCPGVAAEDAGVTGGGTTRMRDLAAGLIC